MAGVLALLVALPNAAQAEPTGRATVIDGDTIEIGGRSIRLFGIDAPESRQTCQRESKPWRCGQKAAFALAGLLGHHWIKCIQRDRDRYRRIVAICYRDKLNINGEMVRQGWALDYRYYSKGRYAEEEVQARRAKRGIWSGTFVKPWDWRRKSRKSSANERGEGIMPASDKVPSIVEIANPFFRGLVRPKSPNNWLIAPKGFPGNPDEVAPVFSLPAEELEKLVWNEISQTTNISGLRRESSLICYVVETDILHFKDDVCIQALPLADHSSTIAAYSASRVGYWDLGVNAKRLRRLVDKLKNTKI
jgi:endonuclease YncB( thermonuclease family)